MRREGEKSNLIHAFKNQSRVELEKCLLLCFSSTLVMSSRMRAWRSIAGCAVHEDHVLFLFFILFFIALNLSAIARAITWLTLEVLGEVLEILFELLKALLKTFIKTSLELLDALRDEIGDEIPLMDLLLKGGRREKTIYFVHSKTKAGSRSTGSPAAASEARRNLAADLPTEYPAG